MLDVAKIKKSLY